MSPHGSFVFALFHEQAIGSMAAHAFSYPYLTLASRSKDGDYAAFIAQKMGFIPVRGSSRKRKVDKGGKEAMFEYIARLKEGKSGAITIDGPKGPRHKCKPGIVVMAQQTGAPILPVVAMASTHWEFNSWDRFKIPKPFCRLRIYYGEPITVPADTSKEQVDEIGEQVSASLLKLIQEGSKKHR